MLDKDPWPRSSAEPPRAGSERSFAEARLRRAVMWCELAPGSLVSEQDLVDRFGLNRAGVRAGLVVLEAHGLVEAVPRHGWRVRPVTGSHIREVLAARAAVEADPGPVRPAEAQLARIEELARLVAVLAGRPEPAARDTLRAYDRELIDLVFAGLGDIRRRWLAEILDHCDRLVRFFERERGPFLDPIDRRPLARACRDGDAAALAAALAAGRARLEAFFVAALLTADAEIGHPVPTASRRRAAATTTAAGRAASTVAPADKPPQPKRTV